MSIKYADNRIQEALRQSKGNAAQAQKRVIEWAEQDSRLLLALTQNHLKGIAAYHIERVASGRSSAGQAAALARPVEKPSTGKGGFGMDILKAVVRDDAAIFGLETYASPPKRGQASQRHINAIHKIARNTSSDS